MANDLQARVSAALDAKVAAGSTLATWTADEICYNALAVCEEFRDLPMAALHPYAQNWLDARADEALWAARAADRLVGKFRPDPA